jgi:hypothetical protein
MKSKSCKVCSKVFFPRSGNGKFCSETCRLTVYGTKPKVMQRCLQCGDDFGTLASMPNRLCEPCRKGTRFTEDEKLMRMCEGYRGFGWTPEQYAQMVEYAMQMCAPKRRRKHQFDTRNAARSLCDITLEMRNPDDYVEWFESLSYCLDARDEMPAGSMLGRSLRDDKIAGYYPGYGDGYGVPRIVIRSE